MPRNFCSSARTEHAFDFAVFAVKGLLDLALAFFSAFAAGASLLEVTGAAGALTAAALGAIAAAGVAGVCANAALTLNKAVARSAASVVLRELMKLVWFRSGR